jgi:hypothetical protein
MYNSFKTDNYSIFPTIQEAFEAKKKLTKKEKAEYNRIKLALSIATILENPRKILIPF